MDARFLQHTTKRWYILRSAQPGERFEKALDSLWRDRGLDCWAQRQRMMACGVFLAIAGALAWTWTPIVACCCIAVGAALCARESLEVARWLDAADRRRAAWRHAHRITRLRTRGIRQSPPVNWAMARAAFAGVVAMAALWLASH